MGVGRVVLCSHGSSSIVDHVAGPLHIWLEEKEGRVWFNKIFLKLYSFKRITWWCLSVLESSMEST
jgi:hypothetical protein